MTEDAKKVWQVMEREFGWSNQPEKFQLEYFEDIIKATKQALTIPVVVGQSEQLVCPNCNGSDIETDNSDIPHWCKECGAEWEN